MKYLLPKISAQPTIDRICFDRMREDETFVFSHSPWHPSMLECINVCSIPKLVRKQIKLLWVWYVQSRLKCIEACIQISSAIFFIIHSCKLFSSSLSWTQMALLKLNKLLLSMQWALAIITNYVLKTQSLCFNFTNLPTFLLHSEGFNHLFRLFLYQRSIALGKCINTVKCH